MIASHVAEVEGLLRNRRENPPLTPELRPMSTRDWLVSITVVVSAFVGIVLWTTGILLGLIAKLFM